MRGVLNTQLWTWHYQPFENVGKVYSNELFFISTNERLMYKFYKTYNYFIFK